ncbi:hypothetical protein GCM10023340_03140 [Nocardioides marinquilinus]|uniref:Uncharacterized protein n=1 Tax=Nocardioides marinquilinus TaxID=1210400 RepID=A0ABP9P710_9ACTN
MSDDQPGRPAGQPDAETPEPVRPRERRGHPVLWGVVALVAVVAVVAGVVGGGVLAATRALGFGDAEVASDDTTQAETLYLPTPSETGGEPSQSITLRDVSPSAPTSTYTEKAEPETEITLVAGQEAVGVFEPIDLNGDYPGGDGAVLRVQQFKAGAWTDFPVTAPVNDGSFYTFIQASMTGVNKFRMKDTDTGALSNVVRVRIG